LKIGARHPSKGAEATIHVTPETSATICHAMSRFLALARHACHARLVFNNATLNERNEVTHVVSASTYPLLQP
jgi:hypothetical protein